MKSSKGSKLSIEALKALDIATDELIAMDSSTFRATLDQAETDDLYKILTYGNYTEATFQISNSDVPVNDFIKKYTDLGAFLPSMLVYAKEVSLQVGITSVSGYATSQLDLFDPLKQSDSPIYENLAITREAALPVAAVIESSKEKADNVWNEITVDWAKAA